MFAVKQAFAASLKARCVGDIKLSSSILARSITTPTKCSFSSETNSFNLPQSSAIFGYNEDIKSMTNEDLNDVTTIPGFTTLIHSMPRNELTPRNALVGRVVSDKMQKTVNVAVDRYKIIPKYRKRMKYTKKFFAHDENEVCATGDLVMIVPCQRISRHKHFMVHEIIKRKGMGEES